MASRQPGQSGNIAGSGAFGYGVGDKAFLLKQAGRVSKYFRSIEFGTEGFVGRRLVGLWGGGTRGVVQGNLFAFGEGEGQQFFPLGRFTGHGDLASPAAALKYLRKTGQPRRISGIVRHEIAAKNAYERAASTFDPVGREREAIAQAFENAGVRQGEAGGRSAASKERTRTFLARNLRAGFLGGQALSTSSTNLAARIDQQFRSELTAANRLLAEALAGEVALVYRGSLKRPATSSGLLEEATLDSRNRFPT